MSDLRIKKKNLAADVVDATKMLLDNESAIRFKKFDGSEMQAIKLSASDKLVFAAALQCAVDPSASDDLVRKGYLDQRFSDLIGSAPETLDTLQEIAALLNNSDVGNLLQSLAGKADLDEDGFVVLEQIPDLAISKIIGLSARLEEIEQDVLDAQNAIITIQGADSVPGSIAYAVKQEKDRAELIEGGHESRLDLLEGLDSEVGSVAYAVKQEKDRAELIEGGHESRLDLLEGLDSEVGSVAYAVKQEKDRAELAEGGLEDRLDIVQGADSVSGSIAYAVKVEKDRAEFAESALSTRIDGKVSQSDFDDLDGYAQEIRSDYDSFIAGDFATAQSDIDQLQLDVAGKASSASVSSLSGEVSGIDGRLVIAEGEIDQLQLDMSDKVEITDFNVLDGRVVTAEGSISSLESGKLAKAGDSMSGELQMGGNKISGLADPSLAQDAATKKFVQDQISLATGSGSSVQDALDAKADLVDGKIVQSQIPAIAIVDTFEASTEAAMLALSGAEQGDVCIRSDLNKTFILASGLYSEIANWKELKTPTDAVLSVNGQTGAVSLLKSDVGLGNVDNTSDADKPISTATQSALDLKASNASVSSLLSVKASTTLNNLGVTSINADLLPNSASARALGSSSLPFLGVHTANVRGTKTTGLAVNSSLISLGTCAVAVDGTITRVAHGLSINDKVYVSVGGTLPSPLATNTIYYVREIPNADSFKISTLSTGLGIPFASSGNVTFACSMPTQIISWGPETTTWRGGKVMQLVTNTTSGTMALGVNIAQPHITIDSVTGLTFNKGASMGSMVLSSVADPVADQDAATKKYVDDQKSAAQSYADSAVLVEKNRAEAAELVLTNAVSEKLPKSGGSMTGAINMGGSKITLLGAPSDANDAATMGFVEDTVVADREIYERSMFVVDQDMIDDGFVDLAHEVISGSISMFVGRLAYFPTGSSPDYSIGSEGGVTRITFLNALVSGSESLQVGDVIHVCHARRQ
jgi:hypothetical protein